MPKFMNCARAMAAGTLFAVSACGGSSAVPSGSAQMSAASARFIVPEDTTSILKKFTKDVVIGSTVDAKNGDMGPRAIALVRSTFNLKAGQLLVCNFANSAGTAGKGTTIEVLNPKPHSKPVTFTQNTKLEGCDGDSITESNTVYAVGMQSGLLSQFDSTGALKQSFGTDLRAPIGDGDAFCGLPYAPEDVYVGDSRTGDLVKVAFVSVSGTTKITEVVKGFAVHKGTGWGVLGPSGIQYDNHRTGSLCNDTLYVVDGVDNTVIAISNASQLLDKDEIVVQPGGKTFTCEHPSVTCAKVVHSGSPLDAPEVSAILPNENLIVANTQGGNKLVEMTPSGKVLATKTLNTDATADIFGLLAKGTGDSDTVLFYTDSKTNTLHELEQ